MLTRFFLSSSLVVALAIQAHAVEPKILTGHTDPAYAAVYSADGTKLVTASFDKTLRLWDLNSATTLRTMSGHTGLVLCAALSKDGSRLVSGSLDNSIRLWDVPVAKPNLSHQANAGTTSLAINVDGTQWLTGGADKVLRIWNAADRALVKEIGGLPHPIVKVAFRADKQQIAAADAAGFVRLFNPADGASQGVFGAHTVEITGLGYPPNNAWIMTSGVDGLVKRFPNQGPPQKVAAGHADIIRALKVNPNNSMVATGSNDKTCRLWNNGNQQPLRNLDGHTAAVAPFRD